MHLLAVSVAKPKTLMTPEGPMRTGIYKAPVAGRVRVLKRHLDGDGQADLRVHGGVEMAVYAYPAEHYPLWRRELAREDLPYGWFGENLTVQGMLEEEIRIGDALRVGSAILQVSQPRLPCRKLVFKMGLPDFQRRFVASGRSGFYMRVLEEGDVGAGDVIERLDRDPVPLSVRELCDLIAADEDRFPELLERASRVESLSPGWRRKIQERLARRLARSGPPRPPG
jgi:MOSC domain-containing protein YiiM